MTGCTKCSRGCENCYAHTEAVRQARLGTKVYREHGFKPTFHLDRLDLPLHWKKPHVIFVNSMSDVFHDDFSLGEIRQVFDIIKQATQHQFLICTKRIDRAFSVKKDYDWPDNLWMGVTAENEEMAYERIPKLLELPAKHRFVSIEPLLGPVCLRDWLVYDFRSSDNPTLDWVICGGETGKNARPMQPEWADEILNQCQASGVPFLYKSSGGYDKKRELRGQRWDEMPKAIAEIFNERMKK